jgi:hypothetical protein
MGHISFLEYGDINLLGDNINEDLIHEEINSRLNSRNACYHSVQNLYKTQNYNFACSFVGVWNLISDIKGRPHTVGFWEQGSEENI